ncbi:Condensin complex subunit 1 [Schistosoma japonicum]|nr:Condensin complex subunit 1 [Schistosoma japonicum]
MSDFVIPVAKADLLKRSIPNTYVVNDVISLRNLVNYLPRCQRSLTSEGFTYILHEFDALFSVLHEWQNVDSGVKEEAWHIVLKGYEVCVCQLGSVLESTQSGQLILSRTEMNNHRNALKMHTYLLCQFVDMFENELNTNAKSAVGTNAGRGKGARGGGRRGARGPSDLQLSMDWFIECEKAVSALDQICRLKLDKLWDPPIAEEDFINLPANCCYKLLEDREIASNANIRIAVINLLATLVRRYGHSIACSVKLAQLLQCFPHMVNCLVAIVKAFIEVEKIPGVVRQLLKEICSYNGADLERDSQASQNFSNFLLEVARAYPSLAQSILPLLRSRLDEEPYQMRNCVLSVIGEILPMFARREQLDPNERVQRDRLMDLLQEHIHDVNGYVRAKALQIWYNIVVLGGLPVSRQSKLAALLVGSLGAMMDVSASARKNACKTLTAMILQCPAAKLTTNELQQVVNKEKKRLTSLEELLAKVGALDENEATGDNNPMDMQKSVDKKKSKKKKLERRNSNDSSSASSQIRSHRGRSNCSEDEEEEEERSIGGDHSEDDVDNSDEDSDATVTLCPTAESDAAAALEEAIHSAAAAVTSDPISLHENNDGNRNDGNHLSGPSPLRSKTVAQTQLAADIIRQRACVAYLLETSAFITHIQTAIKDFQLMLSSKTISDVTEAIEFFVIAKQSGVKGLEAGIRLVLTLIWSQEETVRKAAIEACQKLYLQPDSEEYYQSDGKLTVEGADLVATNLSNFIRNSEIGDLVSMERIIQQLIISNQFDSTLIDHLWQRFIKSAKQIDKESSDDAKSMLLIIKMIVQSGAKEINRHLDTLIRYGLDPVNSSCPIDLERVKFTCEVLERMVLSNKSVKSGDKSLRLKPFRLPTNHILFTRLKTILISTVSQSNQVLWIPMMEQAVGIIYDLSEAPDSIMCYLLRSTAEKVAHFKATLPNPMNSNETMVDNNSQPVDKLAQQNDNDEQENVFALSQVKSEPNGTLITVNVPAFLLSRFLALIGHITLKQLVFMESAVLSELKRRASIQEDRDNKRNSKSRKNIRQSRMSVMENSVSASSTTTCQPTVDEESGLVGVAADDTESDYIRHICDHELLKSPDLVLQPLLNFVTYVCSHPSIFTEETVQASASLALAKMMLVNAEVCEPRLPLLFTMAERSQSEIVRANLIVALGDLCRRFPNLIEPWTPNLYARLRDSSAKVRTNALNTLSHLILNDMVKVKGQISEMTVCLVDEISRLNILARRFFHELSQKGNSLYNVIPDIISRLSDPNIGVSEEHFRSIMEFLIPLIVKERLCETLVEKLCCRFRTTSLERQWRDLAFCLNAMPFSDRMMRVLYENLPAFADKLCIHEVYCAFESIISSVKKLIKPDGMSRLEEFETKVKEFHEKGVADEAAVRRAEIAAKALKRRSRYNRISNSSNAVCNTNSNEVPRRNLRRTTKAATLGGNTRSTLAYIDDNDDTEEDNDYAPEQPLITATNNNRQKNTRNTRARRRIVFSSDEELDDNNDDDE